MKTPIKICSIVLEVGLSVLFDRSISLVEEEGLSEAVVCCLGGGDFCY